MPALRTEDEVTYLSLGDDENRFGHDWLDTVDGLLDDVLASPGPTVLVTHGVGKFFSNGLDVDWMLANPDGIGAYAARVEALFARVLTLPVPTAAAVNGHAFGAGAMLALAHDIRVMRTDRGYFCLPEVDIHIPFTPGMAALIQAKLTPQTAVATMTTGRRFGGADAAAAGIVDATAAEDDLLAATAARLDGLAGKSRDTLAAIKSTMFASVVRTLGAAGA